MDADTSIQQREVIQKVCRKQIHKATWGGNSNAVRSTFADKHCYKQFCTCKEID